uniref:Uncharacterized protein n=1 Tax=Arundo donax TaxID=35708 RepID=A0A0A8XWP0_ARUDO
MPRKYNSPPENCLPRQTFNVTSESSTWKPSSTSLSFPYSTTKP